MAWSLLAGLAFSVATCLAPESQAPSAFEVAVVDRFYPGDEYYPDDDERRSQRWLHGLLDLDRDREREPFYHGDIVSLFAADPLIHIRPYRMRPDSPPQAEILHQLKEIRKHVFWGEPIHAVVLSWESSTLVSAFEKPLQTAHADLYKAQVLQWGEQQETWRISYEIIRLLEDLSESGLTVVTIAGNGGSGMVNTYSFASGVITVGASEPDLTHFISENAFVTAHAPALYQPLLIRDSRGQALGYDLDGDQCSDIPVECLSGYQPERTDYPERPWSPLKGSSFAAPQALKKMLTGGGRACRE